MEQHMHLVNINIQIEKRSQRLLLSLALFQLCYVLPGWGV